MRKVIDSRDSYFVFVLHTMNITSFSFLNICLNPGGKGRTLPFFIIYKNLNNINMYVSVGAIKSVL